MVFIICLKSVSCRDDLVIGIVSFWRVFFSIEMGFVYKDWWFNVEKSDVVVCWCFT